MALIRLLQCKPDGEIVFREPSSGDVPVPAYIILSHTWGKEEVSFQDIEAGTGRSKAGWKKIEFCAQQATADGLEYFWMDTCCIDKKNAVELSAAINSMFRWYQRATRCYVYLSDVSTQGEGQDGQDGQSKPVWEPAFRKSRWFTRGWTLQELIAPAQVDFFSSESERLGNKLSLEGLIHDITSITRNALRNDPLSDFSIKERMSWTERRNTTLEEDKAYCLLGIFDISMSLIYGEGEGKAMKRLQHEIHVSNKGPDSEQFSVGIDLLTMPQAVQFVSRSNELTEMYQLLHGHSTRSFVVLHGLGGIGKTQLALAYAIRHKEKYNAIFWLRANDENSLRLSFRAVAQQVLKCHPSSSLLTDVDLDDLDQVVYAVKAWLDLQQNTRWLMIYDNYDNPRTPGPGNADSSSVDIRQFLPRSDHGSIIITTRSAQVSEGFRIHVQKLLDIQEGLEILSNTSGRKNIAEDFGAVELVKELDGLPLALSTAGAYLEHVTTSFLDYLQLYKASWLDLQAKSPQLTSYEDRRLYTTWQITFNQIKRKNVTSVCLLKVWAYFDRQDLWFELVRHAMSSLKNELIFNEAIAPLCSFGLVDIDWSLRQQFGYGRYSVHSCVHSWMVFVLNKKWQKGIAKLALSCVGLEIPSTNEKNWWLLQQRLLQHATRQEKLIEDGKIDLRGMEWALHRLGHFYVDQGRLDEGKAEKMFIRALKGYEEAYGPEHESTLGTVNDLAMLYKDQGKLAKAEALQLRALRGREVLGPKHLSTLQTVNNLGRLYANQDRLEEAETMYIWALQGYEEALGTEHVMTLGTVNNLGILYGNQGKLAEAEAMYLRALQGYEKALGVGVGPEHVSTLGTVNNLGNVYLDQGKLAEAEAMHIRALRSREEAHGPKHILTLQTVNNLGNVYLDQGKLVEAEAMYVRALQGYEEVEHASTYVPALGNMMGLGDVFSRTDRKAAAKGMYSQALSGYTAVQGPSSKMCKQLEDRLQALQPTPVESGARKSRSFKQKFRNLGRRLNVG